MFGIPGKKSTTQRNQTVVLRNGKRDEKCFVMNISRNGTRGVYHKAAVPIAVQRPSDKTNTWEAI